MNPTLTLHNLTLTYHRHPVVHHVSGQFAAAELTAVVGPNGAGKSTLLKAIAGVLPVHDGRIDFHGLAPKQLAFLPQQSAIVRDFPLTVLDSILLGDWRRSGWFGRASRASRLRAEAALERVGLAGLGGRPVDELSVGQFQRVLFARLLLQDAQVFLLDEPFNALDARTTADLLGLLADWRREGRTVIAVLHDYEQVRASFPQTLLISKECIAWGRTAEVLTPANIARANGVTTSWDEHATICHRDDESVTPPSTTTHEHGGHDQHHDHEHEH